MLLAIDVGNTNVTLALYEGEQLAASWRLATHPERTADEIGLELLQLLRLRGLEPSRVEGVVIGSVVPALTPAVAGACRTYLEREPLVVGPGTKTGVQITYDNPKDVGADRIANALAVIRRFGGPAIVIDFGTAVTYDAIDAEGRYRGGAIAPGIQVSLDALVSHAARLPRVEAVAPSEVIGRSTVTAIQSGLIWGVVSQVEGMVKRFSAELGGTPRVIATGGHATLVASLTTVIEQVEPLLTPLGLRLIYEQNLPR
ncbi:MAG TPA: type III pantothenate kinase [Candidatus Dormibacteraeota bacterium]